MNAFFEQSRSHDYQGKQPLITTLIEGCESQSLLSIHYQSSQEEPKILAVLPEQLVYRNGSLYLQSVREGFDSTTSLRVDRMRSVQALEDEALKVRLIHLQQDAPTILLRVWEILPESWEPLGFDEIVKAGEENNGKPFLDVEFRTRDFFTLKQLMFERGAYFQVLAPKQLRDDFIETLNQMKQVYSEEES